MPTPWLTQEEAWEGYAGPDGSIVWLEATRRIAADLVARLAPPPADPVPQDYIEAAKSAELILGAHLWENPARYSSLGSDVGSLNYLDLGKVLALVRQAMGDWATVGKPPATIVRPGYSQPNRTTVWLGPLE